MPNNRGKTARPRAAATPTEGSAGAAPSGRAEALPVSEGRPKKAAGAQTTSIPAKAMTPARGKRREGFLQTEMGQRAVGAGAENETRFVRPGETRRARPMGQCTAVRGGEPDSG